MNSKSANNKLPGGYKFAYKHVKNYLRQSKYAMKMLKFSWQNNKNLLLNHIKKHTHTHSLSLGTISDKLNLNLLWHN